MTIAIEQRNDLFMLLYVKRRTNQECLPGLPSWVGRWDFNFDPEVDANELAESLWHADKDIPMDVDFNDSVLSARGVVLDTVANQLGICRDEVVKWGLPFIHQVRALMSQLDTGPSDIDMVAMIAQTLIGGTATRYKRPESNAVLLGYAAALDTLPADPSLPDIVPQLQRPVGPLEGRALQAHEYIRGLSYACSNRRVFITSGGKLGLGPQTMQQGDVIAIAYGLRVPIVLRPLVEGEVGHVEFIGHAWVHGVMDGEAVREFPAEGKEDMVFHMH